MHHRRAAVIDIGTNSIRLLIAERIGDQWVTVDKQLNTTRIGEGVHHSGKLSQKGMERTILGIESFREHALAAGVEQIRCFATSAVRDAENREDFVNALKVRTGLDVEILSGEDEAELGFIGAVGRTTADRVGVIDIGGGSTEIIYGGKDGIIGAVSVNMGAVRIMEQFPLGDPVDYRKRIEMEEWIRVQFMQNQALSRFNGSCEWVGIGGTITTLAAIEQGMVQYQSSKIHGFTLQRSTVQEILHMLSERTLEERKRIPGLQPQRADIIIGGTVILLEWMNIKGIEKIRVSDRDNLEGFLLWKDFQ